MLDLSGIEGGDEADAVEYPIARRDVARGLAKGAVGADLHPRAPARVAVDCGAIGGQLSAILTAGGREIDARVGVPHRKMLFQHEVDDTLARGFAVLRRGLWLEHGEPLERLGGIGEDRAVEAGRLAVDQDHRFLAAGDRKSTRLN